ncbi:MAG: HAD-IA family hydrolase, partial [Deinococcales bacterium]
AGALLERLHRRGVPMALVSNGPVDMQRAALAGLKFETYFRSVLVSGDPDVAARKPAPRIFSLACTGLEALPSETAMIGDSAASDVEGALAYGMQAILFGSAAEGERLGVPAAADVEALAALLEERLAS